MGILIIILKVLVNVYNLVLIIWDIKTIFDFGYSGLKSRILHFNYIYQIVYFSKSFKIIIYCFFIHKKKFVSNTGLKLKMKVGN